MSAIAVSRAVVPGSKYDRAVLRAANGGLGLGRVSSSTLSAGEGAAGAPGPRQWAPGVAAVFTEAGPVLRPLGATERPPRLLAAPPAAGLL